MTRLSVSISSFLPSSWPKTLLLLYLLLNLKSLPFAWHLRLFYQLLTNIHRRSNPPPRLNARNTPREILTHPLFYSVSLMTHTPLLEADYNLHKSNSTYLTDMDISRTRLFTRLFSPAFRKLNAELEGQGHSKKGRLIVALGAVHVSFRRELRMYERVEVRSRVIGWDEKWVLILTSFVRRRKGEEELCAVGLSKYVVKKGRFTVAPERVFRKGGWLPSKRDGEHHSGSMMNGRAEKASGGAHEPEISSAGGEDENDNIMLQEKEVGDADEGLKDAQIPGVAEAVVANAEQTAAAVSESTALPWTEDKKTTWDAEAWSWEEIEEERLRGLQLAKGWLALDSDLVTEFERH